MKWQHDTILFENNTLKYRLASLLILVVAAGSLTGCGGAGGRKTDQSAGGDSGLSGTVITAGSTSVTPLTEMLAEAFYLTEGEITVEAQGGGSGQGVRAVEEGIADFGALSRNLKEEERAGIAEEYTIAMDGIAVIVSPDNPVQSLTMEQIRRIYTGRITNWQEVGGNDSVIIVVSREDGSGTRGAFTEIIAAMEKDANGNERDATTVDALIQGSTGAVKQTVAATPDTIGYISLGSLDNTVKAVAVENVEPSTETVLSGDYAIARPFLYITGGELSPAARVYIDFVLSEEGQQVVKEAGFIPVG